MRRWALFVLAWTALAFGWAQEIPGSSDASDGIPFEVSGDFGVLLIRAQINGQAATLLVDTGSSHTLLSPELLQVRPLALEQAGPPVRGSGFTGRAGWAKATIRLGADTWRDHEVLVTEDFHQISKNMKQRVDGILGEDLLKEFHFVLIDFKGRRLVLRR
jgi:hypothetical protein